MDQNTCSIPNLGSQSVFTKPVKMGITGVKEHGVGLFLYRTVNTVKKGADLTIHCINAQLQKFRDRNGCFPDELYVQCDGGSENANKYVLAAMELLVVKRIVKKVIFSRLPPGMFYYNVMLLLLLLLLIYKNYKLIIIIIIIIIIYMLYDIYISIIIIYIIYYIYINYYYIYNLIYSNIFSFNES